MEIEFDPSKDESNRAKHGLSLNLALLLDWNTAVTKPDARHDYGEQRMIGYGVIDRRLYCAVFVERGGKIRVISLRKANKREFKRYEESHQS